MRAAQSPDGTENIFGPQDEDPGEKKWTTAALRKGKALQRRRRREGIRMRTENKKRNDERAMEDPTVKMKRRLEGENNGTPKTGRNKQREDASQNAQKTTASEWKKFQSPKKNRWTGRA